MVSKLASAVYNDVVAGLVGITNSPTISMSQLEDEIIEQYLQIIKEYSLKGIIPKKDLTFSINCISVDCESLDKCPCGTNCSDEAELHFELPQIINDFNEEAVVYIGAVDKSQNYIVYTNIHDMNYHKYKRRGANKPYVFIDTTPNSNNFYDA